MNIFRNARIRRIMSEHRVRIAFAMLAMTGRGLIALGIPFFFGRTVGLVNDGAPANEVWRQASLMVASAVMTAFCQFWSRWLYIGFSRSFEMKLRDEVFHHLQGMSFAWYGRARTGDIMSRLTADVEAVRMGVGPAVMHLYQTGIMAIGAVTIMLWTSVSLTSLAIIPMILLIAICRWMMPKLHDASVEVQKRLSDLSSLAQESFSGVRVIKSFAREDYENHRFEDRSNAYLNDAMGLAMTRTRFHLVIEIMAAIITLGVVWFGGRSVIRGDLAFGPFASYFGYFTMLIWPMIAIGWTLSLFERAKVALARLEEVLGEEPDIEGGAQAPTTIAGSWSVKGLSLSHGDGPAVLENVSFDAPAGSSLAIVGPTGCGKSTLVQVLGRLYDPPAGTVTLDGIDIRDLELGTLRRSIAMVPQETFLFSDSIRANVAYARPKATDDEVMAATKAAEIHESIASFPDGYEEIVGERGVTLSGGQRQRVAIARALLHDAPTLILDDCLSAVDTDTEERILSHLERAMEGRTTIVVAHRLSSVRHCDRIVVLSEGRVIESGSHDELVAAGGWYARTWQEQLLTRELDAA